MQNLAKLKYDFLLKNFNFIRKIAVFYLNFIAIFLYFLI